MGTLSVTLPDGTVDGQAKKILVTGYNNSLTVTVSSSSWGGGSSGTITFSASATFVDLVWTKSVWWVVGSDTTGISYS